VLILQIIIKQWDKSQRTEAHERLRANSPDSYALTFPPAVYILNQQCVIDQHGDDIQGTRVKYALDANGAILFDRFQVNLTDNVIAYRGAKADKPPQAIGSLYNQWIQCHYHCRYSIFESDRYYWLYEAVTLNAICLDQLNENVFLNTEPAIVYTDFNTLDTLKRKYSPPPLKKGD
jgi:hypothetical protein